MFNNPFYLTSKHGHELLARCSHQTRLTGPSQLLLTGCPVFNQTNRLTKLRCQLYSMTEALVQKHVAKSCWDLVHVKQSRAEKRVLNPGIPRFEPGLVGTLQGDPNKMPVSCRNGTKTRTAESFTTAWFFDTLV